ncbi:MAG: arginine deiminase-related protein [Flavobacteriales bacterium]
MESFLKRDKALLQSPSRVLMVEPRDFRFNDQTATSNVFQQKQDIPVEAKLEFNGMAELLHKNHIQVQVFKSPEGVDVPDAVFPNNWIATLPGGQVILFPMMAPNRRDERNGEIITWLEKNFSVSSFINLTHWEGRGEFLEGTGSIVFDHVRKCAYASISARTSEKILNELCRLIGYTPFVFRAYDASNSPVYHTNVVMTIAGGFSMICAEAVDDLMERSFLIKHLENSGHKIFILSLQQMHEFALNAFEVINQKKDPCLIISKRGWNAIDGDMRNEIEKFVQPVIVPLKTIENLGGGSARCMVAAIHVSPL